MPPSPLDAPRCDANSERVRPYVRDRRGVPSLAAGYPLEGQSVENTPQSFTITGQTEPTAAGDMAWAWHDPSGQREAAPIDTGGRFTLHLRFYDVTPQSVIRLTTPAGEVTESLGVLSRGLIDVE